MGKKGSFLVSAIAISILAVSCLLFSRELYGAQEQNDLPARVVTVHDGDTVSVIVNGRKERVRLIGIDAPELGQRPWGPIAKRYLAGLLDHAGQTVTLEFDVVRRDKYGRLLAYIWTRDKKLINLEMVNDGYALLFTFPPNVRYVEILRKAERSAKEKGLGIWGKDGLGEMPKEYKRKHPR